VLFLVGGRVADVGRHREVLARNPDYRHLVSAYDVPAVTEGRADDEHDVAGVLAG
jgi:hypothetical protein